MRERESQRQELMAPVPVGPPQNQTGEGFRAGKHRQENDEAERPGPCRFDGEKNLWHHDREHDNRLRLPSMGAKWAVLQVRHVDVAGRIGARPQRNASALENPGAEIDEEDTIGDER